MFFKNREDAGRQLAEKLMGLAGADTVVLGLPRGGVVLAQEVASALGAPLDIIVSRKLGAPGNPEYAIGAVTASGSRVLHEDALRYVVLPPDYLRKSTAEQLELAVAQERLLRGGKARLLLEGKDVLLIDDGIATGMTMFAAIADVRKARPKRIVVAAPVIAPPTLEHLKRVADVVVFLDSPSEFQAVGQFYADFTQVENDEVKALLASGTAAAG